jgi:hypothetical protein
MASGAWTSPKRTFGNPVTSSSVTPAKSSSSFTTVALPVTRAVAGSVRSIR